MKNIIITLAILALCVHAQAQERTLSTTDGVTYTAITLQRVESDGLYIEYSFPGGGLGMSKVKFSRLSPAQQKQFGFNKYRARDHEAAVAQANEEAAQELIQRWETERSARRQRDAENERAYPARMAEISRINAERGAAFSRDTSSEPSPSTTLSYGAQFTANRTSSQTTFGPVTGGDLFPSRGVIKTR